MTMKEIAKKIIASINPGTADISGIGDGTIKGAISEQNKKIGNAFSTEEVKTNDTWIDGKPLYRKTINFGSLPNVTSKTVNHNISNIDVVMADTSHSYAVDSEGSFFPMPYAYSASDASSAIGYTVNKTGIKISTSSNRSGLKAYITLLYTKTTD